MIKPSNFLVDNNGASIFQNSEHETIALNIIKILESTGDTWRKLGWLEYPDPNFTMGEKYYFDRVIDYTISPDTAKLFCPSWKNIATQSSN